MNKIKFNKTFVVFSFLLLFACSRKETIQIGVYKFETPDWWQQIDVKLPKSINNEDEVQKFISSNYGETNGNEVTWKQAMKCWAEYYTNTKQFPIFIGHCFIKGKDYKSAIKVYTELYYLADTQKGNEDFMKTYLAYSIAETYLKINNISKAKIWFSFAAEDHFLNSKEELVLYHCNLSKEKLNELKNK